MKINTSFLGNSVKGSVLQCLLALYVLRSCDDMLSYTTVLTLKGPELNIDEFANSVNPDELAHDELAHLSGATFLPFSL